MPLRLRHLRQGFTLAEVMVALVIIAVVAVLGSSTLGVLMKKSRNIHCLNNLRQIWVRTLVFTGQNHGRFPYAYIKETSRFWPQEINEAAAGRETRSYICPAVKKTALNPSLRRGTGGFAFVSYGINFEGISASTGSTPVYIPARLAELEEPSKVVAYMDYDEPDQPDDGWYLIYPSKARTNWELLAERHGGTLNVMFCDGHAESVTKARLFSETLPYSYKNPPWVSYQYIRKR